jgi:glycosyltransferase involved in cell wall biosynthesis
MTWRAIVGGRPSILALVTRVLLVSNGPVGATMAGPGIRYRQFAIQLADRFDVALVIPNEPEEELPGVRVLRARDYGYSRFKQLARSFDVVVAQQLSVGTMQMLARSGTRVVYDLYDPLLFERLGYYAGEERSAAFAEPLARAANQKQLLALRTGSAFICASERQRDLWLGVLTALGRIDLDRYKRDPSLRDLVAVVPFGLEPEEPRAPGPVLKGIVQGIGQDDRVLLWGGGIWNWLDPLTPIRAVGELSGRRRDLKLFFLGVRHPESGEAGMEMTQRAVRLADELGVRDRKVFFNFGWTPYAERAGFLLEADIGVSAHFDTVETRYAFRTRLLDYFWARLPTIATRGDVLGDLVGKEGLGIAVAEGDVEGWIAAIERLLDDEAASLAARQKLEEVRSSYTWPAVVEPLAALIKRPLREPGFGSRAVVTAGDYLWSGFRGTVRRRGVHRTLTNIANALRRPEVP